MYQFPIGVIVDSFRTDTRTAILKAAELGAQGIQMYSTRGTNSPQNLTPEKRRELLDFVKSNGLRFSALCGDLGRGFSHADQNPELIEQSKRILDLAKDLETDVVTTHIGVVPEDPTCERYAIITSCSSGVSTEIFANPIISPSLLQRRMASLEFLSVGVII